MQLDDYRRILMNYWGYPDFRGIQSDIINSIGSGQDTLGLMPTGGGKSITFQVPALAMDGVCIVITPLIALMKDQVQHLVERGIRADAIYSGRSRSEIVQILENCIFGGIKILYVSPERLGSDLFLNKLRHMKVSFVTVDEAHCISQWGYDFRPAYLKIADIREIKPEVPVLALTATATPEVVDDIQERLHFKEKNVFRMSFERKNLAYVVRETSDKAAELIHILNSVGGSSIIYARSRKRTKEIAELVAQSGISSTFYHAGLDAAIKDERQQAWQRDEVRVMVATNAFGMGIDKPDVRLVIHVDCPDSLEAYFQEAGRAGRDGKKAFAVLLYNNHDQRKLDKRAADNFPEKDFIRDVYEHLAYYYQIGVGSGYGKRFEFNIGKFCVTYKYFPIQVDSALRLLEQCGYIYYDDNPDDNARLMFRLTRNDLYKLDNLSPNEDNIITALLRMYPGLFSDYIYIDESMIGKMCELTQQQVYMILKNLSARRILDFVPRRKMPSITYTQDREDGDKIIIPKEVYENRKEQYIQRIHSVIAYATNDSICRSRQLLLYFGEEGYHDCGQCDVCLNPQSSPTTESSKQYQEIILDILKDKQPHPLKELKQQAIPTKELEQALQYLVDEEIVSIQFTNIQLKT